MKLTKLLAAGAASCALVAALGVPTAAFAQDITSQIRGQVTGPSGEPVAGAKVTVTDSRTGSSRTTTTDSNGNFSAQNLEPGGPYEVTVDSDALQGERVDDLFISLGQTSELTFQLDASPGAAEEIVVVASKEVASDLSIGPNVSFDEQKLADLPSISRDIRDVIRLDPRIKIDGTNANAVQCVGSNNRFNSFTIDGVRNADSFGLNNSGFQSRAGLPLPFDAIRETTVEFAPFGVEYGQFTGCNINVVTKSGANKFHGSGFATFSSQKLTGSTLEGAEVGRVPFKDYRWGGTFSGPIIKDKLFFFAGYEEYKLNRTFDTGPLGGGFANERQYARLSDVNNIVTALDARGVPTAGGVLSVLPVQSRRILGRVDWNISDNHRLAASYARLREFTTAADDFSTANGISTIALGSTFFKSGTSSETYSVRLFSNWTDRLSTELRVSRADIDDLQDPLGGGEAQDGNPIPRIVIGVQNDLNLDGDFLDANEAGAVVAGPGYSRSANKLVTQLDQIKFKADYELGAHTITAGYELDQGDYYNIFAQNATGTLVFQNLAAFNAGNLAIGSSLVNSGPRIPTGATIVTNTVGTGGAVGAYTNAPFTGNYDDAAAVFSRAIHSLYLQDEWQFSDRIVVTAGIRYDWYDSSDNPRNNANFQTRYGFNNQQAYNGLDAILPRFGISYDADGTFLGDTKFRLGAGMFTGGDPTVWFSNSFSNPGNTLAGAPGVQLRTGAGGTFAPGCTAAALTVGSTGVPQIPACLTNAAIASALAADGRADAVDPNFKVPKVIRANIGWNHNSDFGDFAGGFFNDWTWQFDILYTKGKDSVDFVDVTLDQIGTAIDGRPIYQLVDRLLNAGCTATPTGNLRDPFINTNAACATNTSPAGGSRQAIVLTNALQGNEAWVYSTAFSKFFEFDSPLLKKPASLDVNFGYALTNADDSHPATSSVSTSNYTQYAGASPNANPLATSNYETKHNVTFNATYTEEFFKGLKTSFTLFASARSGTPYSLTFAGTAFGDSGAGRQLLYVPAGGAITSLGTFTDVGAPVGGVQGGFFPTNDPNVRVAGSRPVGVGTTPTPLFNIGQLNNFLAEVGAGAYAGRIAPRNAFTSSWFIDMDFRFQQELPSIFGIKPKAYVDIQNLPNLFSDNANILRQVNFPQTVNIVTLADPDGTGPLSVANPGNAQYIFSNFAIPTGNLENRNVNESVWQANFGLRFEF